MAEELRRYRFGPLERRGLVGSLRPAQAAVLAASLTAGVVAMRVVPGGAGMLTALGIALASVAFCFWPVAGRSAQEWLPVAFRFFARRVSGKHCHLSRAPQSGGTQKPGARPE